MFTVPLFFTIKSIWFFLNIIVNIKKFYATVIQVRGLASYKTSFYLFVFLTVKSTESIKWNKIAERLCYEIGKFSLLQK